MLNTLPLSGWKQSLTPDVVKKRNSTPTTLLSLPHTVTVSLQNVAMLNTLPSNQWAQRVMPDDRKEAKVPKSIILGSLLWG